MDDADNRSGKSFGPELRYLPIGQIDWEEVAAHCYRGLFQRNRLLTAIQTVARLTRTGWTRVAGSVDTAYVNQRVNHGTDKSRQKEVLEPV